MVVRQYCRERLAIKGMVSVLGLLSSRYCWNILLETARRNLVGSTEEKRRLELGANL